MGLYGRRAFNYRADDGTLYSVSLDLSKSLAIPAGGTANLFSDTFIPAPALPRTISMRRMYCREYTSKRVLEFPFSNKQVLEGAIQYGYIVTEYNTPEALYWQVLSVRSESVKFDPRLPDTGLTDGSTNRYIINVGP